MLGHDKLQNYFKTNFALMQHHKYSLTEIENMMPWERFIYINLLQSYLKEEEQKSRDQAATLKAQRRR